MPMTATIITNGMSLIARLPGMIRGTSGGGARLTSPPGMRGGATRRRRTKPCVLTRLLPTFQNPRMGYRQRRDPIAQEADSV